MTPLQQAIECASGIADDLQDLEVLLLGVPDPPGLSGGACPADCVHCAWDRVLAELSCLRELLARREASEQEEVA